MRILIIEDEMSIARLLKIGLESENFVVEMVYDGKTGLDRALELEHDLILLDRMLPSIDGLEICKKLRQRKVETPIIMITARATVKDKAMALDAGANDYLAKPFTFAELISKVRMHDSDKKIKNQNNESSIIKKSQSIDSVVEGQQPNNQGSESEIFNNSLSEINRRILDNAPISIITIDLEGNITSANKYYQTFSKTKHYLNHNIFRSEFFIREKLVDEYKKLLSKGKVVRRENCYERNSLGEDKYFKIIAVPLRDMNGNIEGAISMAEDNTEAVLYKTKLQVLNNDLEEKVVERTMALNRVNEELAKVLELKSNFMSDVSHEMRTSLTIVQGNLELMTMAPDFSLEKSESCQQIFKEISRMSDMLLDLTSLADTDSSSTKLEYKKIDLNQLILSVCQSLKVMAQENNITIERLNSRAVVEIVADERMLEKMLSNLIRNAIRYNKANGWINIWAKRQDDEVVINVEDGGIGIAKENLPFIFERFYRVDKARSRNEGGSGLGLAICHWVAKKHGGTVKVLSKIDQGTIFSVHLPAIPPVSIVKNNQ